MVRSRCRHDCSRGDGRRRLSGGDDQLEAADGVANDVLCSTGTDDVFADVPLDTVAADCENVSG